MHACALRSKPIHPRGYLHPHIPSCTAPRTRAPPMQVYGLHENANISKDITQTQQLLATLIMTGGARSDGQAGNSGWS